jgi:hypothetical protein
VVNFVETLVILATIGLLGWILYLGRTLVFAIDLPLLPTSVDLDPLLFERLRAVRGTTITDAAHGRYTQTFWRMPGWAVLLMIVTLPFGLIFLLVRSPHHLHFTVVSTEHGDVLRVAGHTEAYLWARTCRSLAPLMAPTADDAQSTSSNPATASS